MGIEESTREQWIQLNQYEQQAEGKVAARQERDFGRHPWTQEDDSSVQVMVSMMTGRLARIEQRQSVLYQMLRSILSTINAAAFAVLGGVGVYVVLAVVTWLQR